MIRNFINSLSSKLNGTAICSNDIDNFFLYKNNFLNMKVWLDCDPGQDDMLAIIMAAHS